jgi:ABC-2 type transport system permease protein
LVCFSIPLLLLAPLLGVDPRAVDPGAGGLLLVSLGLAVAVGLALEFLSGALVPLALLPWGLGEVFAWLPFAATASAPLRIYTGTGDALPLLAMQAGWAVALWPLANWLWRANREKLAFHGG